MVRNNAYGTISNDGNAENGLLNGADSERAALLSKSEGNGSLVKRFNKHMKADVCKKWGDIVLLGCYIITGLLDSSSVQVWGSFVSMQTGNTVYLGLGLSDPSQANTRWIRAGISVGCFSLGSFFFARYHRYFGQRKRWVMVSSYFIQLLMIIVAAVMITYGPETGPSGPVNVWIAVPIALIAFQSSGQAVSSRALSYNGLTSVVLTSIYCDLFSDAKLFTAPITENPERNRRAAAPVLVLIGALFGGLWARSEYGLAGAVWTAVVLKTMVVGAWLLWKAEPEAAS